jgi:hypothetical protein
MWMSLMWMKMTSHDPEFYCDEADAKQGSGYCMKGQPGRESSGVGGIRRIP